LPALGSSNHVEISHATLGGGIPLLNNNNLDLLKYKSTVSNGTPSSTPQLRLLVERAEITAHFFRDRCQNPCGIAGSRRCGRKLELHQRRCDEPCPPALRSVSPDFRRRRALWLLLLAPLSKFFSSPDRPPAPRTNVPSIPALSVLFPPSNISSLYTVALHTRHTDLTRLAHVKPLLPPFEF